MPSHPKPNLIARLWVHTTLWLVLVAVGLPIGVGASRVIVGITREGLSEAIVPNISLLLKTLGWSGGVGALAVFLAWPAGWLLGRRGWSWAGLMLIPMMLPSYLAYAAYGLARAPGSWLGNLIERMGESGFPSAPLIASRLTAVLGLALWAWPLAAIVLAAHIRRIDPHVLDALRLDGARGPRGLQMRMSMCRMGLLAAWGVVTLVMLGSAVPFHVGQVVTYAMIAWQGLNLDPTGWEAWGGAWPLLVIGFPLGWWLGGKGADAGARGLVGSAEPFHKEGMGIHGWLGPAAVWGLSVGLPLALLALSVRRWGSFAEFWRVAGPSVARSGWMALLVGIASVGIALAVWFGIQGSARRASTWIVRALVVGALIPGILIGAGYAMALAHLPLWVSESDLGVFFAHVARFGCVGALAGCWLAGQESRELREARTLDAGSGFLGWMLACLPGGWGVLVGVCMGGFALSLHELEATVMLQSPGVLSLSQTVLGWLHYARYEELSAGGTMLIGGTLVLALGAAWGVKRAGG